jgi:hypothetical protein
MTDRKSNRIVFIDAARALAIWFAIITHYFNAFRIFRTMANRGQAIRFFTRAGTPMLLVIFGILIEFIYYNNMGKGNDKVIRNRFLSRSLVVYLSILFSVLIIVPNGPVTTREGINALLFINNISFNFVLKFWVIGLLLAFPLLKLRQKHGLQSLAILAIILWFASPMLKFVPWPIQGTPISFLTQFFFGSPKSYFSLYHGYSFVVAGAFIGHALLKSRKESSLTPFYRTIAKQFILVGIILVTILFNSSIEEMYIGFTSWYRPVHHIGYYAIGLAEVLIWLTVLRFIFPFKTKYNKFLELLLLFGRQSLFSYVLANILLTFIPAKTKLPLPTSQSALIILGMWGVTYILTFLKDQYWPRFQSWVGKYGILGPAKPK